MRRLFGGGPELRLVLSGGNTDLQLLHGAQRVWTESPFLRCFSLRSLSFFLMNYTGDCSVQKIEYCAEFFSENSTIKADPGKNPSPLTLVLSSGHLYSWF